MIVVDTSILGYLYLNSERSAQVEQLLRTDAQWVAPVRWRSELRSVLALYLRGRMLQLDQAEQIMDEAVRLMMGREYEVVSSHVLTLTASSTCSAYACEFVALAMDLGVHLVTTDPQILEQFPGHAVALGSFVGA